MIPSVVSGLCVMSGTEIQTIYLDATAFIAAQESDTPVGHHLARLLYHRGPDSALTIATSVLTVAEVLVIPFRTGDKLAAVTYIAALTDRDFIRLEAIDAVTVVEASLLRADNNSIKLPDAIHLVHASAAEAEMFVTGEKRLSSKRPGAACQRFGASVGTVSVVMQDGEEVNTLIERYCR